MDCASEESEIRRAVEGVPGVLGLRFQLGERSLRIAGEPQAALAAVEAIRNTGFEVHAWPDAPESTSAGVGSDHEHEHAATTGSDLPRLLAALALATAAEGLSFLVPDAPWSKWVGLAVAAAAIALAGFSTFSKGLTALRHGRLNINALMSVAVAGAFVIGQWPEAAMVMALYAIAELIEARSVDRARNAISGLLALSPDTADLRQPDGSWKTVPVGDVPIGATVRVRPGERVAMDAVVTEGSTSLDQAPVTGESLPVDKGPGDAVFAGTINQTGTIECRVTAAASQSTLARIIHAVEQAQGSRAPTQRFVDRFAAVYTPAVFVLALAVAIAGPWLFGWTVLAAVYKALVLLVIACPCALVISTPVTVVSGLASAARRGILIKGGVHLEQARLLKAIALDKTGTLTEGKPKVTDIIALGRTEAEVLRLAAALEAGSSHPLATAILARAAARNIPVIAARDGGAIGGKGVTGMVGKSALFLGSPSAAAERTKLPADLATRIAAFNDDGKSVSVLLVDDEVAGAIAMRDEPRPDAKAGLDALRALGAEVVMLTGDNARTATAIAAQLGIEPRAELLPADKQRIVNELKASGRVVAKVGDGINDAPALAAADIGIAMGGGTDVALETADAAVLHGRVLDIANMIGLSRATMANIVQNITISLGLKAFFLVTTVIGVTGLWPAILADTGATVLVTANAMRLLGWRGIRN